MTCHAKLYVCLFEQYLFLHMNSDDIICAWLHEMLVGIQKYNVLGYQQHTIIQEKYGKRPIGINSEQLKMQGKVVAGDWQIYNAIQTTYQTV